MGEEQFATKITKAVSSRASAVRFRTWALSGAIIIALIFYFLMQTFFKDSINLIDFFFLCLTSIVTHFVYFADGEIFGQKDKSFIANRQAYNDKANKINEQHTFIYLKQYCDIEFEERKKQYIVETLSDIGITEDEFKWFKQQHRKTIEKNESFEMPTEKGSKLVVIARGRKRKLIKLLYEPLPIRKNEPATIMSALVVRTSKQINDNSRRFKISNGILKIFMSFIVGAVFAYTGYHLKDGIGLEQITLIFMFIATIFSTAVTSFSSGEVCQRVFRKQFYVELSLFIDGFNEWLYHNQKTLDKQDVIVL